MTSGARRSRSPVRNSQARMRLPALAGVIWVSGEKRIPPRAPPQCSQATAGVEIQAKIANRRIRFRTASPQEMRRAARIRRGLVLGRLRQSLRFLGGVRRLGDAPGVVL